MKVDMTNDSNIIHTISAVIYISWWILLFFCIIQWMSFV